MTQLLLRVYRANRWSLTDIQLELDFLAHLDRLEAPVAPPVPTRNGASVLALEAAEGSRPVAAFSFVPGKSLRGCR